MGQLTVIVFVIMVLIVESMHFVGRSFHRGRWWGTILLFYTGVNDHMEGKIIIFRVGSYIYRQGMVGGVVQNVP